MNKPKLRIVRTTSIILPDGHRLPAMTEAQRIELLAWLAAECARATKREREDRIAR